MRTRNISHKLLLAALLVASSWVGPRAWAQDTSYEVSVKRGDEVEITSGAVTALACALEARDRGTLDVLNACPLEEATRGIVVFDVEERQIYEVDAKKVRRFQLEKAFGGGSIDFSGKVTKVAKNGVAAVEVEEFSITPKPKAGAFKGCL